MRNRIYTSELGFLLGTFQTRYVLRPNSDIRHQLGFLLGTFQTANLPFRTFASHWFLTKVPCAPSRPKGRWSDPITS